MRVCMFVYNRCTTDTRVLREAASLQAAGHEVTIVAVLDGGTAPAERLRNGVQILRINRRPLHYRLAWWARGTRQRVRLGARRTVRRLVAPILGDLSEPSVSPNAPEPAAALVAIPLLPLLPVLGFLFGGVRRAIYLAHKPLMYLDFWGRGYRAVAGRRFDVFHAHDLNTLPVAALLARRLSGRLVYDAHELYPDVSTLSRLESRTWRRVEPTLIGHADRVLTVCDSISEELSRRYDVAAPVVLLNCPPRSGPVDRSDSPLRESAGLGQDAAGALILYQGGFAPNRGLPELIRAMHSVEGAILVLLGWGRLEADLEALVQAESLQRKVRILPPVDPDELPLWTAGADIGAIPYQPVGLNNTFSTPNKLFEYIAAGVPIVATRLPEITRIVEGHGLGLTFAQVEPTQIAAAITQLLHDPAERAAIRARAAAVREQYTWEHQARKLLALYEELVT